MTNHQSDSAIQRAAVPLILAAVADHVGKDLVPRTMELDSGAAVQVDGVDADESVFVEIFARQGALKGGQRRKVSQDALKLITLGRTRPSAQLIIAFADEQAATYATTGTWVSQALATWGVEVLVVALDQEVGDSIRGAQLRQKMVNPAAAPVIEIEPN